jgi:DNA-binding MarR family transcriptional regulator
MIRSRKSAYRLTDEEAGTAAAAGDAVISFRLIVYAGQRLRTLLDQRLRVDGLTTQQGVLLSLVRARGRPTLGEITREMGTSHQNAKQIAAALERKGMLSISTDANDRRVRRLEATAAGKAGWTDRNQDDFAAIGAWFAGLTPRDQGQLAMLLGKLVQTLPTARGDRASDEDESL